MSNTEDGRWWAKDFADERHKKIQDVIDAIRSRQERWRKRDLLHACLYGNMEILGFGPDNFWKFGNDDGRLTWNIVKPKVDTWVSLICRSKPEAMYLPNGSGASGREMWTVRRQCRELQRAINGKLDTCKYHTDIAPLVVLDVGIFDYGLCKVSISGVDDQKQDWKRADAVIERAYPHQMIINDAEAMNGDPRSLFQRMPVDRYVAMSKFPGKKEQLQSCDKGFFPDEGGTNEVNSDVICLTEAWHLPSSEDAGDGRHCLIAHGVTLIDEPYEGERFPFARLTQMPVPMGIRGQSIAHQLRPIQVSLNQLLLDFQDAAHTIARGKWSVPNQSGIEKGHIDDQIGSELWYDAPFKPEVWSPQSLPPDVYKMMTDHSEWADQTIGISSYRSAGIVPTNLKSGKAQEVANDTQDGRFLISSRMFEAFAMDVCDLLEDKMLAVAKKRPDYASRFVDKTRSISLPIKFADIKLTKDQYTRTCYPASALANTPGARYDQLEEMRQNGVIDLATYRKLLDFPDIAGEMKQLNAPQYLAEKLIERFLNADDPDDENVWIAPEGRWPIQTLYEKFLYATADAQLDECPDGNIRLMERFMTALEKQAEKIGLQLPGMPPPGQGAANTAAPLGQPGGAPPPMMPPGAMAGAPLPAGAPPPMPPAPPMQA